MATIKGGLVAWQDSSCSKITWDGAQCSNVRLYGYDLTTGHSAVNVKIPFLAQGVGKFRKGV